MKKQIRPTSSATSDKMPVFSMLKIKCPMCSGSGKINPAKPKRKVFRKNSLIARELKSKGFSVHEIMIKLGYKSRSSVHYLLNEKDNWPRKQRVKK